MKAFIKTGLVVALCMTGIAAYGQEPVKAVPKPTKETTKPAVSKTNPPLAPAKKSKPVTATRPKTAPKAEPAKKIDFAPTK